MCRGGSTREKCEHHAGAPVRHTHTHTHTHTYSAQESVGGAQFLLLRSQEHRPVQSLRRKHTTVGCLVHVYHYLPTHISQILTIGSHENNLNITNITHHHRRYHSPHPHTRPRQTSRIRLKLSMSTPTSRFARNNDPSKIQTKKYKGTNHAS